MLISCPECKKEISDKAQVCPNCGCPNTAWQPKNVTPRAFLYCKSCEQPIGDKDAMRCPYCASSKLVAVGTNTGTSNDSSENSGARVLSGIGGVFTLLAGVLPFWSVPLLGSANAFSFATDTLSTMGSLLVLLIIMSLVSAVVNTRTMAIVMVVLSALWFVIALAVVSNEGLGIASPSAGVFMALIAAIMHLIAALMLPSEAND